MGQIKMYGLEENLNPIKKSLSDVVHSCMVEAFNIPKDKKFHRFFPMKKGGLLLRLVCLKVVPSKRKKS